MADLRIGVVGTGMIGKEHIKRFLNVIKGAVVVAVTDVLEESGRAVAEQYGLRFEKTAEDLINAPDVDVVVVTTPGFAHAEIVLKAIAAGKHCFCEKPLAETAADCKRIMDAEMKFGKKLVQVGFMRRYDKGYRQIKEIINSGTIGDPILVKCAHRAPDMGPEFSSPMMVTECMIHEIDILHWLTDDVYVSGQMIIPRHSKNCRGKQSDPQVMILRTKKGLFLMVEAFVACDFAYDIQCEVVCDEGTVRLPDPSKPEVRRKGQNCTALEMSWMYRFMDAYNVEIQEWVDSVRADNIVGPNSWDGYVAAVTADVCVKAQTSGAIEPIPLEECPVFYR